MTSIIYKQLDWIAGKDVSDIQLPREHRIWLHKMASHISVKKAQELELAIEQAIAEGHTALSIEYTPMDDDFKVRIKPVDIYATAS